MSSSAKVYALGSFTSKLAASYLDHIAGVEWDDGVKQPSLVLNTSLKQYLSRALETAELPVSNNIVHNLLKAIEDHHKEQDGRENDLPLSWGEFCACCIDLYSHHNNSVNHSTSSSPQEWKPHPKHYANLPCQHEVFLGGSCNPTTWRKDSAIPTLHQKGVTYFNPQVDNWFPELIEIEEQAKMAASLLLFVVDDQTRAISSMVEVAYLAGQGRDVVAVVKDISNNEAVIAGETLSSREIEDLNRGRLFIRNLVEEGGCFLADSLESALSISVKVVKERIGIKEYCSRNERRLKCVPPSIGEQLHLLRRVFSMYDNEKKNRLTLNEAELALRSLHIEGPQVNLSQLLAVQQDSCTKTATKFHDLFDQYKLRGLTFDEFCTVYSELKYSLLESKKSTSFLSHYVSKPLKWITDWLWTAPPPLPASPAPFVDVFLNGSCGSTTWRADISIPILKQHGVSYFNPQVANWDRLLLPIEQEAKERCSVLLYVVTGETLSVASLVEAAYYIGKGRSVVLCMSDISCEGEEPIDIEGMKLGKQAVKDYNRGRAYLTSMANKNRIPVYSTISAATTSAVHIALCLRGQKVQSHYPNILTTYPSRASSV